MPAILRRVITLVGRLNISTYAEREDTHCVGDIRMHESHEVRFIFCTTRGKHSVDCHASLRNSIIAGHFWCRTRSSILSGVANRNSTSQRIVAAILPRPTALMG